MAGRNQKISRAPHGARGLKYLLLYTKKGACD
nr:MAG TPA: hypothetical protein [Caudoviricetes sp.]